MDGMVSVIIPVYNRENVLLECVESVLTQTYQNFEIILIDDGSTDKTLDICKTLSKQDSRIRVIENAHAGVSAARNSGLDSARGEYVFFIDSDDVIHPMLLNALVCAMKNKYIQISGTQVLGILEEKWSSVKELIVRDNVEAEVDFKNHKETLDAFFYSSSPINLIGGVMMRRDLIGDTRFNTQLYIGEDFYFIYENIIKGATAAFLKQKWYYCRFHKNNISKQYDFDAFWTRFYRRVLVWKNEEKCGRLEYVKRQKNDAINVFFRCMNAHSKNNKETKKMCKVLKEYRKDLLPILSTKLKIRYILYVYFPSLFFFKKKILKNRK